MAIRPIFNHDDTQNVEIALDANGSNFSFEIKSCLTPQTMPISSIEFSTCYLTLFRSMWFKSSLELLLAFLIVSLNLTVIIKITLRPFKKNIFEKVMIAHCIVDGLTGLIDAPMFHLATTFGYWPFGPWASLVWASTDNSLNFIKNGHMLHMTWIRFRSIKAPNTYEKELTCRHPVLICVFIWIIGIFIWLPITFSFGVHEFSINVKYMPDFVEIFITVITWLCPLLVIIMLAIYILVLLNKRRITKVKKKRFVSPPISQVVQLSSSDLVMVKSKCECFRKVKSRFRLGPQARFQIIMTAYWLQWIPSCIIALIQPICGCVSSHLNFTIYWLTYTVCLTDPLIILIFNPNSSFYSRR